MSPELLALAAPAFAILCVAAARRPEWVLLAALTLIAAEGSIEAFAGTNPRPVVQGILLAFVVGSVGRLLLERRAERLLIWPWLLPIAGYVLLTAAAIPVFGPVSVGIDAFLDGAWFMVVGLVAALALRDAGARGRLLRGLIVLAALVGGYAAFRWVAGPAPQELAVADRPGSNVVVDGRVSLFGSFPLRGSLARWCAHSVPLCIAVALLLRGPWRWAAAATATLCAVVTLGTEVRIAAVAVAVATLTVLVAFQFAGARRGPRIGTTVAAVALAAGVGASAYVVAVGSDPARAERFSRILTPAEDPSYGVRLTRWPEALRIAEQNPLGLGLGVAGRQAATSARFVTLGATRTDNAYIQVLVEQGIAGLAVLVVALLALGGGLAVRASRTADPERAAAAIGAVGSLAALAVLMYTGLSIGGLPVVLVWVIVGLAAGGFTTRPQAHPAA